MQRSLQVNILSNIILPIYLYGSFVLGSLCVFILAVGTKGEGDVKFVLKYGTAYTFLWPILILISVVKTCWKVLVEIIKA